MGNTSRFEGNTIRRFQISDALVLTAAIAISIVACRLFDPGYTEISLLILFVARTFALVFTYAIAWIIFVDSVPLSTSASCPGKLGILLTAVMGVFAVSMNWHYLLVYDRFLLDESFAQRLRSFFFETLFESDNFVPAYSTIAAWVTLSLRGGDKPATDWMERWGIVLGLFWISSALTRNAFYHQEEILRSVGITP